MTVILDCRRARVRQSGQQPGQNIWGAGRSSHFPLLFPSVTPCSVIWILKFYQCATTDVCLVVNNFWTSTHWIKNSNKWIILQFFYITDKQKINKMSISFSFHSLFWVHFNCHAKTNIVEEKRRCSIFNEKNISKRKLTDKTVPFARLCTSHHPDQKRKQKRKNYATHKHSNI